MYYIVKKENTKYYIYEVSDVLVNDRTMHNLQTDNELNFSDVAGQFGRREYAETWKDYYNKEISQKELRRRLDLELSN